LVVQLPPVGWQDQKQTPVKTEWQQWPRSQPLDEVHVCWQAVMLESQRKPLQETLTGFGQVPLEQATAALAWQ
jgi:hypothetical protein